MQGTTVTRPGVAIHRTLKHSHPTAAGLIGRTDLIPAPGSHRHPGGDEFTLTVAEQQSKGTLLIEHQRIAS